MNIVKPRKQLIVAVAALTLSIAVFITGCGKSNNQNQEQIIYPETTEAEPLTIGYTFWDLPIDGFCADQANQIKLVAQALGVNLIFNPDTSDLTADGMVKAVDYFAEQGVDGIVVVNFSDESLLPISKTCEENQIPFIQATRTINDSKIAEVVEANPYYIGRMHESDYSAAYEVGRKLIEGGAKNILMVCPEHGDIAYEARAEGFRDACEEPDVDIVEEVWEIIDDDSQVTIIKEALERHPEVDGIFMIRCGFAPLIIGAQDEMGLGKYIPSAGVDINNGLSIGFENGAVKAAAGGHHPDASLSMITLINCIRGAIDYKKQLVDINYSMLVIDSLEAFNDYKEWCLGYDVDFDNKQIMNANDARGLCVDFNPEASLEDITKFAENMSLESVKERHRAFIKE